MDMMKNYLSYAVAAAFFLAPGTANLAFAQAVEQEPNDTVPVDAAKRLVFDASRTVEVTGSIGVLATITPVADDVDYYSFYAKANDVVTIDIDGGMKPAGTVRSLDSVLAIYGPDMTLPLRQVDDVPAGSVDAGSMSRFDARLDEVKIDVDGIYTVAVASSGRVFSHGGAVSPFVARTTSNGSYTLIISGVSPSKQVISIDIKPGTDRIARLNPKSKGDIAVALLSSPTFDALKVDRASLTFGATGDEQSLERCARRGHNVDRKENRLPDLICQFDIQKAGFEEGDEEGVLRGTIGGMPFEGKGWLKVIPVKRKHKDKDRHHHHDRDDD
jgi:hypothetical protein